PAARREVDGDAAEAGGALAGATLAASPVLRGHDAPFTARAPGTRVRLGLHAVEPHGVEAARAVTDGHAARELASSVVPAGDPVARGLLLACVALAGGGGRIVGAACHEQRQEQDHRLGRPRARQLSCHFRSALCQSGPLATTRRSSSRAPAHACYGPAHASLS